MISYNSASRPLCIRIKSVLEQAGYTVWIDVEDIHGSSLDSMARAVEDAAVVLVCVTEKYRQSLNCQAEAQYAFKMSKPIVPLIMEKGYENVKGWLGIIISDKIFINFTKYEFDECLRRLLSEIKSRHNEREAVDLKPKGTTTASPVSNVNQPVGERKPKTVEKWSGDEVNEWMISSGIDKSIIETIVPCDGLILRQFYELRRDAPEFFFQTLSFENSNQKSIDHLKHVLKFSHCLTDLFQI